jgi:hypothetical protein
VTVFLTDGALPNSLRADERTSPHHSSADHNHDDLYPQHHLYQDSDGRAESAI